MEKKKRDKQRQSDTDIEQAHTVKFITSFWSHCCFSLSTRIACKSCSLRINAKIGFFTIQVPKKSQKRKQRNSGSSQCHYSYRSYSYFHSGCFCRFLIGFLQGTNKKVSDASPNQNIIWLTYKIINKYK